MKKRLLVIAAVFLISVSCARAVDDVSFEIPAKGVYGLVGESGSGKSTLVKALASGSTMLDGERVLARDTLIGYFAQHQLDELHNDWSPYDYFCDLMPEATQAQRRARLGDALHHLAEGRARIGRGNVEKGDI